MSSPNYKYGTGLSNVGSYQVSGKPFLKGGIQVTEAASAVEVEFPTVTRWIYISASGPVKVGMSAIGVDAAEGETNYVTVDSRMGNLPTLEWKCTKLFLSASGDGHTVDIAAGLTGIPVDRINNISPSGSNWSGSVGIG
tara:strand:- start:856 stop:1272 length:417 start_codon:yes stop_codon:yes gene_type:complete